MNPYGLAPRWAVRWAESTFPPQISECSDEAEGRSLHDYLLRRYTEQGRNDQPELLVAHSSWQPVQALEDDLNAPTDEALAAIGRLLGAAGFEGAAVTFEPGPGYWTIQVGPNEFRDSDIHRAAEKALASLQ